MDVSGRRRVNFRTLVDTHWGGIRWDVARDLNFKDVSTVARYLAPVGTSSQKNIGHQLARKIETVCGLEHGWLDSPHDEPLARAPPSPGQKAPAKSIEARINALPEPLRQYLLLELQVCEQVANMVPSEFTKPPTLATRRTFQNYVHELWTRAAAGPRRIA